ncbi:hypothetical protein CLORY_28920 [Clostridium oryzae]|uniref:Uncharacterized protein n=1 Tax=Clostridium oryzae TaxID=1450648 RepID=A0A1V4ILG6_9CLOT|nr:hypothetical protein CLORY_28920 [Clostridium oryzae]
MDLTVEDIIKQKLLDAQELQKLLSKYSEK